MIATPAEHLAFHMLKFPETRWAILAPKMSIAEDICIPDFVSAVGEHNLSHRSQHHLFLKNGSQVRAYSGQHPHRLRGPLFHGSWVYYVPGEISQMSYDYLSFATKLRLPNTPDAEQWPVFS